MRFKINVINLLMINLILFFIFPILSFFIFGIELMVLKEKQIRKIAIIFFCLSIGMIGYIFVPPIDFDLYRHYESYEYISKISFIDMLNLEWVKNREGYYSLVWVFGALGISKHFLPFISIFIFYFGILIIVEEYYDQEIESNYLKLAYISIILLLMNLEYINFISQIRGPIAAGLLFIGYYFIVLKKKKKFIVLPILACTIHFSIIPLVILFLLIRIEIVEIILIKYKNILLLCILIIIYFMNDIILLIREVAPIFYQNKIDTYFLGKWSKKSSSVHKYEILYRIQYIYLIFLIFLDKTSKNIKNYIVLIILFLSLNVISKTTFMRYMWYTRAFQYGYYIYNITITMNPKIKLIKAFVLFLLMLAFMILGFRIYHSYIKIIFDYAFKNLFQIFSLI